MNLNSLFAKLCLKSLCNTQQFHCPTKKILYSVSLLRMDVRANNLHFQLC